MTQDLVVDTEKAIFCISTHYLIDTKSELLKIISYGNMEPPFQFKTEHCKKCILNFKYYIFQILNLDGSFRCFVDISVNNGCIKREFNLLNNNATTFRQFCTLFMYITYFFSCKHEMVN